jgi:hypothetical protein
MPSRLRLFITLLGFAVLGASFYFWVHYIEDEYEWIRSDSSRAPAAETDEIWQVSATCQLPYLVGAVLRAKAKLKFYTDAAPAEIREWRNSLAYRSIPPGADKTDLRDLSKRDREKIITAMDYDAKLHARYTEWYVLVSKLEEEIKQWEWRLSNVTDKKITYSDAHRLSFRALQLLGLGGFPDVQEQRIKEACVKIIPVKKIVANTNHFTEIWRWPVDNVAAFWFGLELVFVGIFFSPIAVWIRTGNSPSICFPALAAWTHSATRTGHLVITRLWHGSMWPACAYETPRSLINRAASSLENLRLSMIHLRFHKNT